MLDWLSQNSGIVSALANVGMLLVWIFYAQLLYNNFRRQRRPRVLINKGVGSADLDSPCLICNMSSESIFIESILVDLETTDGTYSVPVTDTDEQIGLSDAKLVSRTRQGPLAAGSCLEIHRFGDFLQRAADAGRLKLVDGLPEDAEVAFRSLTVTVISIYGSEDKPFGASRKFELNCDERGRVRIKPASTDTARLSSRDGKKRAKELLEESF